MMKFKHNNCERLKPNSSSLTNSTIVSENMADGKKCRSLEGDAIRINIGGKEYIENADSKKYSDGEMQRKLSGRHSLDVPDSTKPAGDDSKIVTSENSKKSSAKGLLQRAHAGLRLSRSYDPNLSRISEWELDEHQALSRTKSEDPRCKHEGTGTDACACQQISLYRSMLSPRNNYSQRKSTLEKINETFQYYEDLYQQKGSPKQVDKTMNEPYNGLGEGQGTPNIIVHDDDDETVRKNNVQYSVDHKPLNCTQGPKLQKSKSEIFSKKKLAHVDSSEEHEISKQMRDNKIDRTRRLFRSWSATNWTKRNDDYGFLQGLDGVEDNDYGIQFLSKSQDSSAMQKASKSPSTGRRILPKIRKSKTKALPTTSLWREEGENTWTNISGRRVVLTEISLSELSEKERLFLQKISVAKLQSLDLGCPIVIPKGDGSPKRQKRIFSIKKRSQTTNLSGIIDNIKDNFKDKGKDKENRISESSTGGLVFGIPLSRCISNDVALRRRRLSLLRERKESNDKSTCTSRRTRYRKSSSDSFSSGDNLEHNGNISNDDALASKHRNMSSDSLLSDSDTTTSIVEALSLQSPVSTLKRRQSLTPLQPQIPHVVKCCFQHLKTHGLQTLGIFRVCSSKKRTKQLRDEFDTGKDVKLTSEHNPHDVGALLKEFFRDLPEPLLTRDLYSAYVATRKITDLHQQTLAMRCLISLLPVPNRDTLQSLLNFLSTVCEHSNDTYDDYGEEIPGNKMDSHNLATLFGPNLLHKAKSGVDFQVESVERAEERKEVIEVIQDMVELQKELFAVPAEVHNEMIKLMMEMDPDSLDYLLKAKSGIEADPDSCILDDSDSSSIPQSPSSDTVDSMVRPRTVNEARAFRERHKYRTSEYLSGSDTGGGSQTYLHVPSVMSGGSSSSMSEDFPTSPTKTKTSPRSRRLGILQTPHLKITSTSDDVFVSDSDTDRQNSLKGARSRESSTSSVYAVTPSSTSPMKTDSDPPWNFTTVTSSDRRGSSSLSPSDNRRCSSGTLSKSSNGKDRCSSYLGIDSPTVKLRDNSPSPSRSRSPIPYRKELDITPDSRRSSITSTSSQQRPLVAPSALPPSPHGQFQQNRWQHWEKITSETKESNCEQETLV